MVSTTKRISAEEVAATMDLNVKTVYGMLRAGTIPSIRAGRLYIISRRAFESWWESGGMQIRTVLQ